MLPGGWFAIVCCPPGGKSGLPGLDGEAAGNCIFQDFFEDVCLPPGGKLGLPGLDGEAAGN